MSDLISFWLNQCNPASKKTYDLLAQYQYNHDWIKHGDLGGLNVKTSGKYFEPDECGEYMIAQGIWYDQPSLSNWVDESMLFDVIAWHPEEPKRVYFYRGEPSLILGERFMFEANILGKPLMLKRSPFDWLKSGCEGSVLLDKHSLSRLYGLNDVVCTDVDHGERIQAALSQRYLENIPNISIPSGMRGAA